MHETDVNKNNIKGDMTSWLGKLIGTLSRKCEFERIEKWYDHAPESVLKNEDTSTCRTSMCEQFMKMRRGDYIW